MTDLSLFKELKRRSVFNKVAETTFRAIGLARDLANGYLVLGKMLLHYRQDLIRGDQRFDELIAKIGFVPEGIQ